MNIGIILTSIFLPSFVSLLFSIIQKTKVKVSSTISDNNFTVYLPNIVLITGAMCVLTSLVVLLCFTFLSNELPHLIFYVVFGLFMWLGMYLIVKTLTFKVIVRGKIITVYSAFRRPYSFAFDEIVSVVRQVKKNQTKSERIVIKTTNGEKLIVENTEVSYKRFEKKIQSEVKGDYLVGF